MAGAKKAYLGHEKLRAREQWSEDPCGEVYGKEREFGTREFFDEVERHRYEQYAPWMREVMGFDQFAGARLVEIGCGMGTDLLQFARGGASCTGVDLTPRSVEISRLHFDVYRMTADFALSDAERLPFADESFDVFYSNGVLHHTPDTETAIREAHRILKPGGTAKVMLYHRNSWAYWVDLILKQGIYRRELFRGLTPDDLMSKYVEYSSTGASRPLVKAYSRGEVQSMFTIFRDVKIQVEQLTRPEIYFAGKFIPESLFSPMRRTIGWNLIITAIK
jgi:ubiquinone/menaquinone biosynthesis C-methylase UbiE